MTNENCKEKVKFLLKIVKYFEEHKIQARTIIFSIALSILIFTVSFSMALIIQAKNNCFTNIINKITTVL